MATNLVKLEDVINQAKETLETDNTDYALALCRYILKYYPGALEVTRVLGEAYTEKKLLKEADELFVYVLAANPHDLQAYAGRGTPSCRMMSAERSLGGTVFAPTAASSARAKGSRDARVLRASRRSARLSSG